MEENVNLLTTLLDPVVALAALGVVTVLGIVLKKVLDKVKKTDTTLDDELVIKVVEDLAESKIISGDAKEYIIKKLAKDA
jgi:hypothetical protein